MLKVIVTAVFAAAVPFVSAFAADMPVPVLPAPVAPVSSWYLRGDIGVGAVHANGVDYLPNPNNNPSDFTIQSVGIGDQAFLNAGIGYEVNNWLRLDVTGEYRTKNAFNFWGGYTTACPNPFAQCLDVYNGYISSLVFLANAYIDIGTWYGVTPFVGAGVGTAGNQMSGFSDVGIPTGGSGVGPTVTQWNLAWAIHAGLSYAVSENLKLELAYRYLNMGNVEGPINCTGGCNPDSYRWHGLSSQDVMIGFRWMFNAPSFAGPPPPAPLPARG
ncbi:MAG TPA: outer membrane beta-barrel protein [Xanthobacteraceae bacterium]|jgi:opacity protein-like surface antigen|nr:outer membrane beta-barrel protein [Xanthobacteraceae bacterium]